ncbi:MAG: ribosome biogenesis GTP-binding protein YihA/YsxC [Gemmatimonadaceae bacterium]|jgi:GTP-binding protein|nr:ribosome biogenesis GTP-binding protein YihA/YsxC [Gemmatimonadaceae bacterium]
MSDSIITPDPLVIRSLEFIGPMAEAGGWRPPSELPEIAFVGRSNVGKSSLLNRLVRRKAFARVSNTPGRTREINFFRVNNTFVLADLPGYGYARISKERKAAWKPLIEGYLRRSPMLRGVVQLLDVRHDPTSDDDAMLSFLADVGVPTLLVLTKIDKLRARERDERLQALTDHLGVDPEQLMPFSSVTGEGRDDLAEAVVSLCAARSWREHDDEDGAAAPEGAPPDGSHA